MMSEDFGEPVQFPTACYTLAANPDRLMHPTYVLYITDGLDVKYQLLEAQLAKFSILEGPVK